MRMRMRDCMRIGWPDAKIRDHGNRLLAYHKRKLVADVALYEKSRWAFFHYGYGGRGGVGDIAGMLEIFRRLIKAEGWTATIKGGNPLLGKPSDFDERDFSVPTEHQLSDLKKFLLAYLKKRFPNAVVGEMALYAGMAWVVASGGKDGLGIRDIDVNVFFEAGGPRSLAWITKLKYEWNGVERTIDLYWNTLPKNKDWTATEYIYDKWSKAKAGRWLTIPDRPWVSLLNGVTIWKGLHC